MSDFWVEAKEKKEGVFLIEHFNYSSLKIDQSPSGSSGVSSQKGYWAGQLRDKEEKGNGKGEKSPRWQQL